MIIKIVPFSIKILVLLLIVFAFSQISKATTYTLTPTGDKTNTQIRTAINTACSCTPATLGVDTVRILVTGSHKLAVAPDNQIWDLTDYGVVKMDIDGENSQLYVNKKAEIRLSEKSFLIVSPTNTDGFVPENTGNSYLRIGTYDFHGNGGDSFSTVIAAGGGRLLLVQRVHLQNLYRSNYCILKLCR